MRKYTHCQKCKNPVSKNCQSGICNKCRDRKGENNPFFGKKHSKKTIENVKKKCVEASKQLWKNEEYRNKVISGISKPRRKGFGEEQSERITKWYRENPEQIMLRSEAMKKSWIDGKIEPNINSINESKDERNLLSDIQSLFPERNIRKSTIKIGRRWFYPDIRIDKSIIIEFFGDYWHGNPIKYNPNDLLINGLTAGQIWERDKERIDFLRANGFIVLTVWQNDYKNNRDKTIKEIADWLKSIPLTG
jgi:hypothetical protein